MPLGAEHLRHASRGITLLELLIVLVILSIVLAVSMPSLKGTYQRSALTSAGRDLVALMRIARAEAIFREHPVEVRFDLAMDRYRLDLMEVDDTKRSRHKEEKITDVERIHYLPRDVSFMQIATEAEETESPTVAKIVFFPNGSATGATILLKNLRGRMMKIELAHATALAEAEYYRAGSKSAESREGKDDFASSYKGGLGFAERSYYSGGDSWVCA